jgi:outer membrane receptor protein involved in Fe transport
MAKVFSRRSISAVASATTSESSSILVDGVRVDEANVDATLDDLDPSRVESIEVIKGFAAVRLYGNDAPNGAVLITLKPE